MKFMNAWDIDQAVERFRDHPALGAATLTLRNLRDVADRNSDGWCYWPKPARSAARLMELIEGDGTWEYRFGKRSEVTAEKVRQAYRPIKGFLTRSGLSCEIVDPADQKETI